MAHLLSWQFKQTKLSTMWPSLFITNILLVMYRDLKNMDQVNDIDPLKLEIVQAFFDPSCHILASFDWCGLMFIVKIVISVCRCDSHPILRFFC